LAILQQDMKGVELTTEQLEAMISAPNNTLRFDTDLIDAWLVDAMAGNTTEVAANAGLLPAGVAMPDVAFSHLVQDASGNYFMIESPQDNMLVQGLVSNAA
jgi:hypothetical protein